MLVDQSIAEGELLAGDHNGWGDGGRDSVGAREQGLAVDLHELLWVAEAAGGAGGEDDDCYRHESIVAWIGRASSRSDLASRWFRTAWISAMMASAISSGVSPPRSRPIGEWKRSERGVGRERGRLDERGAERAESAALLPRLRVHVLRRDHGGAPADLLGHARDRLDVVAAAENGDGALGADRLGVGRASGRRRRPDPRRAGGPPRGPACQRSRRPR